MTRAIGFLVVALTLLVAGPASAATVATQVTNQQPPVPSEYLVVTDEDGAANDMRVEFSTTRNGWSVHDDGATLTPGPACVAEGADVFCPRSKTTPYAATVTLGGGDDKITVSGALRLAELFDGAGDDAVHVASDATGVLIHAGAGADSYESAAESVLSYTNGDHERGVSITLDGTADDGMVGEGDNVTGSWMRFEGTLSADKLRADDDGAELRGIAGDDDLIGGPGDDQLVHWGDGNPNLLGGPGNDGFDVQRSNTGGTLSGGPGRDSILFEGDGIHGFMSLIDVSLDGVANDGPAGGQRNVLPDFEWVNIQEGTLVGGDGPEVLRGSTVDGRGGDDEIFSSSIWLEELTVTGGAGRDILHWGDGDTAGGAIRARDGEIDVIDCFGRPGVVDVDPYDIGAECPRLTPGPVPPASVRFGVIAPRSVTTRSDSRGYVVLRISCATASPVACSGVASIRPRNGIHTTYAKASFRGIAPGTSKRVKFKLASRWRKSVARGKSIAGRLMVDATAKGTTEIQRTNSAGLIRIKPRRQGGK